MVTAIPKAPSRPWPVWVWFAVPCSAVFLPVYFQGALPAGMARNREHEEDAGDSLWWKYQQLEFAAATDLARNIALLREAWKAFEEDVEAQRVVAGKEAVGLN